MIELEGRKRDREEERERETERERTRKKKLTRKQIEDEKIREMIDFAGTMIDQIYP